MPSDAAFREAVMRYRSAVLAKPVPDDKSDAKREEQRAFTDLLALYADPEADFREQLRLRTEEMNRHDAQVAKLYAEQQGAEYEICHVEQTAAPHEGVTLVLRGPFSTSGKMAGVGDRVRVTKVEEGR